MAQERDFDFLCRWCGNELILQSESFSSLDHPPVETWWHMPRLGRGYSLECRNEDGDVRLPVQLAEPTRWTEAD